MKKKKLGIDVDGVLRNFMGMVEEVYKKHYPDHEILDRTQYDLKSWFPIGGKIYDFAFKEHAKEIYLKANQYPQAAEFMELLKESGHKIIIVTSQPNEETKLYTLEWLKNNEIEYDKLIFESEKFKVNVDVLLDDSTKNLEEFAKTNRLAVCMDRTWNQDWEGPRIKKYKEFIEMIENG